MAIEFSGTADPHGLEVFDSIEQRRISVRTDRSVTPTPIETTAFPFPVDAAYRIETATLQFDQRYLVNVHDADGRATLRLDAGEGYELDTTLEWIGLDGPIKLYCRASAAGTIDAGLNSIKLSFDRPVTIDLGARSLHERPAGTITTPDEPAAMMEAVSALASALKTETPERSWPTLRGHPPLIERGDRLDVGVVSSAPETELTIRVPPTYQAIYTAAPLAYYLGASLRAGDVPAIETEHERHRLGTNRQLEDDVARTLKRVFVLDCVVRTEGIYQYDLRERSLIEPAVPWSLGELYEASPSDRLERYLEVPYDVIEPVVPRWPLTAHVPSRPSGVEILPFVVNELGIVREPRGEQRTITPAAETPVAAGTDENSTALVRSADAVGSVGGTERSDRSVPGPAETPDQISVVEPAINDESIEHAWFGDEIPLGASKATIEGYRNQLDRVSRSQSIEILVVCNDAQMLAEHDVLDETYGSRELLPFDVTSKFGVSTDELATLLTGGGYDFLHYIGHATSDGLRCPDGDLDVRSLSSVDLGAFFLNACHSYEQGVAMARRGAFGGVATLGDIDNEYAVESGAALARLLNLGFPLRGALEVVGEWTVLGEQYLVVGDGSTDIAQTDGGAPTLVSIDDQDDESYEISFRHYHAKECQIGSLTSPNVDSIEKMHLLPMDDVRTTVTNEQFRDYVTWTKTPILLGDSLHWNTDVGPPPFLR